MLSGRLGGDGVGGVERVKGQVKGRCCEAVMVFFDVAMGIPLQFPWTAARYHTDEPSTESSGSVALRRETHAFPVLSIPSRHP